MSANDSVNFLLWLQTVRSLLGGKDLILTAATTDAPFHGPSGAAMMDVSGFAEVLEYISVYRRSPRA
jgi:chitinase